MKKTGVIFTAIFFVCIFFAGQVLAVDLDEEHPLWQINEKSLASHFLKQTVSDRDGEDIGQVHDIVFGKKGKINFLILSKGGILGIGADLIPIPWKAENIRIQDNTLILNMDGEKVENAPSFTADEWPRLGQEEFLDEIHSYYETNKDEKKYPRY